MLDTIGDHAGRSSGRVAGIAGGGGHPRGMGGFSQFCRADSAPHEKRGDRKVPSNFAEYDSAGDRAGRSPAARAPAARSLAARVLCRQGRCRGPNGRPPRGSRPAAERLDIVYPPELIFGVWVNFSIRKGGNVVKLTVRDKESIQEAVRRFRKLVERLEGDGRRLLFCYEAGPCGYELWLKMGDGA